MTLLLLLSRFSRVRLCVTPKTAAHQAPPSLGFSRQEHWSGLPFPSPMHESEKWKWSRSVVSDCSWPRGLQPTRLLHPWDFPGKSTGVGHQCLLRKWPQKTWILLLNNLVWKWKCQSFSPVWLSATPWTVARRAPLSLGFPRQEYWSGLPLPSPSNLPLTLEISEIFSGLQFP